MFNKSKIDGAFEMLRELTAEMARLSNAVLCIADLLDNGIDVRIIKNEDEETFKYNRKKPFKFAEDDELPDEDDEEAEEDEDDKDDNEEAERRYYYGEERNNSP